MEGKFSYVYFTYHGPLGWLVRLLLWLGLAHRETHVGVDDANRD